MQSLRRSPVWANPADDAFVQMAEKMVGEARERRTRQMPPREAFVRGLSAMAFVLTLTALATLLPNERPVDMLVVLGLVVGYALVSRVRFEFGDTYVVPEQLLFVPMLALAPLP